VLLITFRSTASTSERTFIDLILTKLLIDVCQAFVVRARLSPHPYGANNYPRESEGTDEDR
jgi:hypothetical protein